MKHLLALPAVLRTAALLASASQHSFSVHDDILAFPQYQVRFEDAWVSEERAQSRLANSGKVEELREPQYQLQQRLGKNSDGDSVHAETEPVDYEQLLLDGQRWLCRVPRIKKREDAINVNETQSKAEEEKELARASDRGWELLSGMQDNCIYFIGGWWSYRFCYNEGVRQFHQLPPSRGIPSYPPQEDPGVPGFMLGTYNSKNADVDDDHGDDTKWEGTSSLDKAEGVKRTRGGSGELVQRGESRYLAQTLGGGTRCDLTGKERKIEVQYHCNPQGGERISLIKEMATCTYLMVIQTPRLCNDVAFQPPQKDQPNTVSCSPILREDEVENYERDVEDMREAERLLRQQEVAESLGGSDYELPPLPVGDILVGMHKLVPEGQKIEKSAIVGGGKEVYIDTLASSDGKTVTQEDLKRLGLADAKTIENLRKEIEKYAAQRGEQWKLDVVDTARGREYRGIVGTDDEDSPPEKTKEGGNAKAEDEGQKKQQKPKQKGKDKEQPKGSEEEYYKEEL